jgi:hypothetical protein
MMTDMTLLRDQLDEIGSEAGLLPVDVGRARVRGRRILRLRRAAAAAGSAAIIGVVVVAVAVAGRAAPPGHRAGDGPQVSAAPPRAEKLVRTASFGWLPVRLAANSFVADSQDRPYFEVDAGTASGRGPVIMLTAFGRGPQPALPDLPGGVPATLIPAARVNGHRAYWITAPTTAPNAQLSFELRWQYAPDRWADLQAAALPATSVAALTRVAYKIAATATLGGRSPVALPIGVAGIPRGLRVRRAVLDTGQGLTGQGAQYERTRGGALIYGTPRGGALILFAGRHLAPSDSIQFSVSPTGVVRHHPGNPGSGQAPTSASKGVTTNTVIDGHPAYDSQLNGQAGDAVLWVFGVQGFDVEIGAGAGALAAMPSSHNLIWLFSHMTVVTGGHRPAGQ